MTGPGQVSDIGFDHITIDGNYELAKKDLEGVARVKLGDGIEFEAVKCVGRSHQYRCLWGKVMDTLATEQLLPDPQKLIAPIEKASANRGGITIDQTETQFRAAAPGDTVLKVITVKNISASQVTRLIAITLPSKTHFEVLSPDFRSGPCSIQPQTKLDVIIRGTGRLPGIYPEGVTFEFSNFQLMRNLKLICGDAGFTEKYTAEYTPATPVAGTTMLANMNKFRRKKVNYIPSSSVVRTPRKKWDFPVAVKELLLVEDWNPNLEVSYPHMFDELNEMNYQDKMHTCLYVMELELFAQFQQKNQYGVLLEKVDDKSYGIYCKDVAEARPSVMVGDTVYLENKRKGLEFNGRIADVRLDMVVVTMEPDFGEHSLLPYDIVFSYSRAHYKIQHDAVDLLVSGERFTSVLPQALPVSDFPLLDVQVEGNGCLSIATGGERRPLTLTRNDLNASQRQVVRNVLRAEYRALPYLIRGPPGTGKTTTLCEIVIQLATHCDDPRILICTQSNSAANLILAKLVETRKFTRDEMIRVVGMQAYTKESVAADLLQYCGTFHNPHPNPMDALKEVNNNGIRVDLELPELCGFKVVMVTCGSVGRFLDMKLSTTHFTHLLLDEAGQCHETEALMAIAHLAGPDSQLILAGDDKQLGPVVQRPELKRAGFEVSLFERLMRIKFYDEEHEEFNKVLSNTLFYNYRSVPSILHIYNGLFYNYTLKPMVRILSRERERGLFQLCN